MKQLAKYAVLGIALSLCGCASRDAGVGEIKTAQELKTKMDAKEVRVIHSLNADNYAKGHIPGAENVDYEKMTPQMLPAQKEQALVFYCAGPMCPVSKMAANKAAKWGYMNVSVYEGGLSGWKSAGMSVATGKQE